MSSNGSAKSSSLSRLTSKPFEFDFVQAVTILQRESEPTNRDSNLVGFDIAPRDEAVRFRVKPTLRSTSAQVLGVKLDEETNTYEMTIPFIGLVGVHGVLPRHYTQTIIRRGKQHDYSMLDFFDLFHHRIISMYFRASTKYRLPYVYQSNAVLSPEKHDAITQSMLCLVGLGEPSLKNKLSIHDHQLLSFGGHFSDTKPTAHSLERMVENTIGVPSEVQQFQLEWLYIDPKDQSRLAEGAPCRLGQDVVIGERVPSFQSKFRVRVGPVGWSDFLTLLPNSESVVHLSDLVRTYVGINFDFDLQVAVDGRELPELGFDNEDPPVLGWTTWLISEPPDRVVDDAVFDISQFREKSFAI